MYHEIRWTREKLRQRLELVASLVYRRIQPLPPFEYRKLDRPRIDALQAAKETNTSWQTIPWNTYWGERNINFLLQTSFQTPRDWRKEQPIALYLPIGTSGDFSHPEALVYLDGRPTAACDRHHQEIPLAADFCDGTLHKLLLHGWTGLMGDDAHIKLLMRQCALVQIDPETRDFHTLARIALNVAEHLHADEPARAHLYNALDEAFKLMDTREPFGDHFYASVPLAHKKLQDGITQSGPAQNVEITAVGHAHIDLAWLWTLEQTRLKAGRTFHNVLRLMEQFPTFRFVQSQPQLYEFIHNDYPDLFKAIQARVRDGQWEPIGGMWVESDCNISGGETLVRQFLLGRPFYSRHFGEQAESPVLWLPDVFGFPWSLPQLIKQAGLDYFFTIKLGWSQYNRLPYDSFWWQGLDGTRVLTHFSTTRKSDHTNVSTYNAEATPEEILQTWKNFLQKDWGPVGVTPPLLMSFGHGDGGGGPTYEMLENIRAMDSFPAMPRVHSNKVLNFFRKLESDIGNRLPTWNDELYLEYHRGTYTTQAQIKRLNRRSEFLLHDVEFLSALTTILDPSLDYPHEELQRAWKLVCLNQFHDILPGTSIREVYDEAVKQYADVQAIGDRLQRASLTALCNHLEADLIVVNPSPFIRHDLAYWPSEDSAPPILQRHDGLQVGLQHIEGGWLLDVGDTAPYSVTPVTFGAQYLTEDSTNSKQPPLSVDSNVLENEFLRVEINTSGDITRIYDKINQRETLPHGEIANQFQAFEDRPKTPDAWEIDIFYDDRVWFADAAHSIVVVENGSLRGTIEVRRRILGSEIVQRISLTHNSQRLDFDTMVDWRERHMLLKVAFPVDILSPRATYEIQWGNIERPTHRNTSWDWARFETCAHKWVDLSEGGYGVSLLNDCKYGHDIHENVIRLTLLRGPTYPDPKADQGEHHFTYSLLPHAGRWGEVTAAQAYALNDPYIVWMEDHKREAHVLGDRGGTQSQNPWTPFNFSPSSIIVETVKQAEDGKGLILRLYEYQRRHCNFELTTSFPLSAAWRTNLLEKNEERLEVEENRLQLTFSPYQIMTIRLIPKLAKKTKRNA